MPGAAIHPSAVIDASVVVEDDVEVGPFAVVTGEVVLGRGARIGAHCVIGATPKVKGFSGSPGRVVIGDAATISEFCAVDAPTGELTEIGRDSYLMPQCYIGHDTRIERGVTLTAGCRLGGHVWIGELATLGLGTVVHQFSSIGALCMVGMQTTVNRDIPPFCLALGVPGRVVGCNRIGLGRNGFSDAQIEVIEQRLPRLVAEGEWELELCQARVQRFEMRSRRPHMEMDLCISEESLAA